MSFRGQGAFEYLLLLGGTVLVATVATVMTQGSILEANAALNESATDYSSYIEVGVNDVLVNNSLVHELPTGCTYSNPPCVDGYFCDNGACVQMNALLSGYVFDPSGLPLSGATVFLVNGTGFNATTSSTGYYDLSASSALPSNWYAVAASRVPSNAQSTAVVNLTVGFGAFWNFTLAYNPATLSGFVRDPSGNGITGVSLTCGPYSATTVTSGAYSISSVPMSSASVACTLAGSKSPTFVSNSTSTSFNAGVVNSQDLQLSYAAASMSGYVRNPSSVGIGGATVTCGPYSATTAGDGSYSFGSVPMSAATLACTLSASSSPTFVASSASVAFIAGTSVSQSLQLSYSGASVSGYVRDASSVAVSGAAVSCAGYSATTAGDGSYTISGVAMSSATSTCTLAASKSGYTSASATAALTAGAVTAGQNLAVNLIVNGVCGSSNGANFYSVPSSGFCNSGTASAVSGSGPWSWACAGAYGGSTASCSANKAVNGVCGAAHGVGRSSVPTGTALCSYGTASGVSGSNPWSWACYGINGGSSSSCYTLSTTLNYVYFTSSTTWTVPSGVTSLDVYALGGGGGGGDAGCGGGGGYTTNVFGYAVSPGQAISVTVGAGGPNGQEAYGYFGADGGSSGFGSVWASGGSGCHQSGNRPNGGSGGGGQCGNAVGGSDGSGGGGNNKAGSGQGSTTRPFQSSSFAPLGAGGGGTSCRDGVYSHTDGGYSGGGHGCSYDYCTGSSGSANTGGGGGSMDGYGQRTGSGGSGIVIIRYYG